MIDFAVRQFLNRISVGRLTLELSDGTRESFGTTADPVDVVLQIRDQEFFKRIRTGSLGLGEAYVDGLWDVAGGQLCEFLGLLVLNFQAGTGAGALTSLLHRLKGAWGPATSPRTAGRHISLHYDLGNALYELFLDDEMTYSCGYLASPADTLEQMQQNKYRLICEKVDLAHRPGKVLDIGCGWGGFLRYVERHYSCVSGLGVTLSQRQQEWAAGKFKDSSRFRIDVADYRSVTDTFDTIASIGMFEHVGKPGDAVFMQTLSRLLKKGGRGLLHTMGVVAAPSVPPDPWISKYIFPGHRLPRLEEIVEEMHRAGLLVGHIENLQSHYAETFYRWRMSFNAAADRVLQLGPYDERFLRLFNYYLQSCEAGFRYGRMQLYQIAFAHGRRWTYPVCFPMSGAHSSVP